MAQAVLNLFGYSERIFDNVLEPEDRDAFYMLEDSGILTTEREETTLYDGREWRIPPWRFRQKTMGPPRGAQEAEGEGGEKGAGFGHPPPAFLGSPNQRPSSAQNAPAP